MLVMIVLIVIVDLIVFIVVEVVVFVVVLVVMVAGVVVVVVAVGLRARSGIAEFPRGWPTTGFRKGKMPLDL